MRRLLSPALLFLGLALAAPLAAQQLSSGADRDPARDREAARALRAARSEQARFERVRRNHLDWTWGGGGGDCDERIGRFCLTHSESTVEWESEPEPAEIGESRERLLARLAEAARLLPADRWVSGQRVRYLVEAQRIDDALAAARACRADAWWCTALEGFAHHNAGHAALADAAFTRMLRAMPARERKEWTDLSLLLDSCAYDAYRRLDEAGRDRFEERFWHLADPFHSRPGNELRSEHFARNVWDALQDRAKSTEGITWGDDLREILLRYGWPRSWKRIRGRPGQVGPASLVSHYSGSDRDLLPPCETLAPEGDIAQGSWDEDDRRPKTSYALPMPDSMIEWVFPLDHQVAVFRRGDSALVVAAYATPADSFPDGTRLEGSLALLTDGAGEALVAPFAAGGFRDAAVVRAPAGSAILTLELLAEEARRAARAREGVVIPAREPGAPAVSDLLLLRSPDALPDSLEAAVAGARADARVRAGEQVGVYWEVYGAGAERPEQVVMSLRLEEEGAGWLKRFARRFGIVERVPPVRVRWQDAAAGGILPRSLALQIPDDVPPGKYTLHLAVTLPGRDEIVSSRRIEVVR